MGLKYGHFLGYHPSELVMDFVWINGMLGTTWEPMFQHDYDGYNNLKRGIIHQPVITNDKDIHDNYSAFEDLLANQHKNNWDNGVPIIVDIWEARELYGDDAMLTLNDLLIYGERFRESMEPSNKPLLRMTPGQWENWMKKPEAKVIALKVLEYFDILSVQPGWNKPSTYQTPDGILFPKWFEYEFGLVAFDASGNWLEGPVREQPPAEKPEEPPVQEPGEETPEQPETIVGELVIGLPIKYVVKLFGFLPLFTIEAVEGKEKDDGD